MQLFSRNKAIAALSLGALAALGACGDDVTVAAPTPAPVTVAISPSNANVAIGSTVTLAVTVTGGTTTPDFTCSVTPASGIITVAKVAGGCAATGVASGSATVIATAGTASAAAAVTVAAPAPAISGIAITPAAINLQVGGTTTITANPTSNPTNATVTRAFVSSNPAVATVNATTGAVAAVAPGTATITATLTAGSGATAATVSGTATVTVTALPPSVTAVSATPTSATLIVSQTQQITATATYATGNTGNITYGTSNPGVATVSGTGLITAVGPGQAVITVTASSAGNASFAAASATAQVPVTVNAAPQVSIANITQAQTNNPVNINSVAGQIQVELNLATNNNVVSSVRLFVCNQGVDCTATAQPAASQTFGTAGAANGSINLFINTADFTTDFATATARYLNGQKNLIAVVNTGAFSNANSNLAILNFNNTDGFAARHTAPTRSAVNVANNTTVFGGPDAAGRGRMQIAPLFYTPNRSLVTAQVGLTGVCGGTLTFGGTGNPAFPIDYTYGYSLGTATGANATNIVCAAESNPANAPDVSGRVLSSIDNAQNAGPSAANAAAFATTTSSTPAVTAPAIIRVDYVGPSFTVSAPATQWASIAVSYSFRTNTSSPSDAGVGPRATSTFTYVANGCGLTDAAFDGTTGSGVMPECPTNFTQNVYTVTGRGTDLLDNASTATSGVFGIDNTAPAIRYTVAAGTGGTPGQGPGSFADTTTFTNTGSSFFGAVAGAFVAVPAGTDTIFGIDVLDERSGLTSTAATHYLARATQTVFGANGTCVVGTSNPGASTFITAPACTPAAATLGTAMADGYRPITRVLGSNIATEGYYTYQARVVDRAGNPNSSTIRRVLHDASAPLITGLGLPGTITAAGPNTFTPNFSENVEAHFTNLWLSYSGLTQGTGANAALDANFVFPATLFNARFDNSIGLNGNVTVTTPFTSGVNMYTNIEQTAANGAITAAVVSTPDSASARVTNVAGLTSGFFGPVQILGANVATDATAWATFNSNIQSFALGTDASAWNAPANGLKAVVTANTNQINSPFTRVDFYELVTGAWVYLGSVDGTAAPSVSPAGAGPVYIADNGTNRVWTYRLTTVVNGADRLIGGNTAVTGALNGARRFIAVATNGTKGRALSTNVTASQVQP